MDCGKGVQGYHTYGPNFLSLNQISGMESPSRTDALLISHGHYDHIGYLPDFADMCPYTPVYATQTTKEMGKHLMWDRFRYEKDATWEKRMGEDYLVDKALQRIHGNGYGSSFIVGNVKITFYEAGHIPWGGYDLSGITGGECVVYRRFYEGKNHDDLWVSASPQSTAGFDDTLRPSCKAPPLCTKGRNLADNEAGGKAALSWKICFFTGKAADKRIRSGPYDSRHDGKRRAPL